MERENFCTIDLFCANGEDATENKEGIRDDHLYHLGLRKAEIENKVKIGDRVYAIRYKVNGKEQVDYVVCSAENYKVICSLFIQ